MGCQERFFSTLEEYQKSDVRAQSRKAERRHRIASAMMIILIFSEGAFFIAVFFYFSPNAEVSRGIRKAEELVLQGEYKQAIEAYIETLEIKRNDEAEKGLTNACLLYADQLFVQENYQKAKLYYNFVLIYDDNNERAYMGVQACEFEARKSLMKDYQELLGGISGE